MTSAQLARLAELAAYAAGFFGGTDPRAARLFAETAERADALSTELLGDEERVRCGPELSVVTELAGELGP